MTCFSSILSIASFDNQGRILVEIVGEVAKILGEV
jgi:hypothetical protein